MNAVEKKYAEMWDAALPLFEQGKLTPDPHIHDSADIRRGLTLRARPTPEVVENVKEFTERLRAILPSQYYIPVSDLHMTILTLISCQSDLSHDPAMDEAYCSLIQKCVRDVPPPRINFRGITLSPSSLLLSGYSENNSLSMLRQRLRERFKSSQLPSTVDFRYFLETAHVTIMRFTDQPDDIAEFTRFIKANRYRDSGTDNIREIELVNNDWYHTQCHTKIIRKFKLSEPAA